MEFQFKPGDFVTLRADVDLSFPPPRYTVLERFTQECMGGIQRHYHLRSFGRNSDGLIACSEMRVHDFEVVPYPTDDELTALMKKQSERQAELTKIRKDIRKEKGLSGLD
jgi:hypothetical protein